MAHMPRPIILTRNFAVRLTEHDGDRLEDAVTAARIQVSDWLRTLICRELKLPFTYEVVRRHVAHSAQLDVALGELAAIGRNLNQATHALNIQANDERGRAAQVALVAMQADIRRLENRIYDLLDVAENV